VAWLDDRVWCHPKTADLSSAAFAAWVKGIAYSSGMSTSGRLSTGQLKFVGGVGSARRELVAAGLWEENGDGVVIHDWEDHNGKRDARRRADRERKRQARSTGESTGHSAGTSAGQSADSPQDAPQDGSALNARRRAPDDGSDGSDGRTEVVESSLRSSSSDDVQAEANYGSRKTEARPAVPREPYDDGSGYLKQPRPPREDALQPLANIDPAAMLAAGKITHPDDH